MRRGRSHLFIIFTTVLVDLIGFGMVIPLIGLYGRHYGAQGLQLPILGGIYSMLQFFFAPIWGSLSDRFGRRPILLMSLAGSTVSYLIFGLAPSFWFLFAARAFGGIFAANISTAQAYIADVTTPQDRAKGMGLIGAAFGIGFTLGPPIGGIAAAKLGLGAPGFVASAICGVNLLVAIFRLPESLPKELRSAKKSRSLSPINWERLGAAAKHHELWFLFLLYFFVTFAFSNMEQTFSLLFQNKFGYETGVAGYRTGLVLMASGILGAAIQGGYIRKLVPRFGERRLLITGLCINIFTMAIFPYLPSYDFYFILAVPLAIGSSLINPTIASLISRSVSAREQGATLGVSQGLGSLARATGPFCGLLTFALSPVFPYAISSVLSLIMFLASLKIIGQKASSATAD